MLGLARVDVEPDGDVNTAQQHTYIQVRELRLCNRDKRNQWNYSRIREVARDISERQSLPNESVTPMHAHDLPELMDEGQYKPFIEFCPAFDLQLRKSQS